MNITIRKAAVFALFLLAFYPAASGGDAAPTHNSDEATAAEVRAQLKSYFSLVSEGKWEAAAITCYCLSDDEGTAAQAIAKAGSEFYICDRLARQHFETNIFPKGLPDIVPLSEIDQSEVLLVKNAAMVTTKYGDRFPMVRVNGTWRLSIQGIAKMKETPAILLAATYLTRWEQAKKLHANLEKLQNTAIKPEMRKQAAFVAEALAMIPTDAQLEQMASDQTPAGALTRFIMYSAAAHPMVNEAMSLCHADNDAAGSLVKTTAYYWGNEQQLYQTATLKWGRAAADRILPRHLSPEMIQKSTVEEKGDKATMKLPSTATLPLIRINGHWKLDVSEYCKMKRKSQADVCRINMTAALTYNTIAKELLESKYDSPDAVLAAMTAGHKRVTPSAAPKSASLTD